MVRAALTSRPSVGSSKKSIFGSVMKPRQKFIFWRWPVERWLMRRVRLLGQADDLQHFVDPAQSFFRRHPVKLGEEPKIFANGQDAVTRRLAAGHHVDALADRLKVAGYVESVNMGRSRSMEPTKWSRMRSSVVLPAPLEPSKPNSSPWRISSVIPSRATKSGRAPRASFFSRRALKVRRSFPFE